MVWEKDELQITFFVHLLGLLLQGTKHLCCLWDSWCITKPQDMSLDDWQMSSFCSGTRNPMLFFTLLSKSELHITWIYIIHGSSESCFYNSVSLKYYPWSVIFAGSYVHWAVLCDIWTSLFVYWHQRQNSHTVCHPNDSLLY